MIKIISDINLNPTSLVCVALLSAGVSYYGVHRLSIMQVDKGAVERVELVNSADVVSPTESMIISPYDSIFREVCYIYENDWRLMSAIAYHESRFRADVKSSQGARGLMQIMPSTAEFFGVEVDRLMDVEINIVLANLLMNRIEDMMKFSPSVSYHDRTALTLACYNGGIGYIRSAQRLAKREGVDPFSWSDISQIIRSMSDSEFSTRKSVRHFRGASQTLTYVENVMNHYDYYCEIAEL